MSTTVWVSKIIDSLPVEYKPQNSDARNRLEKATNEKLRQLGAKIPVRGSIKHDSDEARAAIVLEHMLRKKWHHFHAKKVPLETLLKPTGMNRKKALKNIENLQQMLGSYLDEIDRGYKPTSRSDVESIRAMGLETIRDLSISLGAMLADPGGTAKRADLLFSAIIEHTNRMERHDKSAALYDLQRNGKEYAAGCFHLYAKSECIDTKKGWGRGQGQESDEEEIVEREVTEFDIIHECKLAEKQAIPIFETVAELSNKIGLDETRISKKRKISNAKKKNEVQEATGIGSRSETARQVVPEQRKKQKQLPPFVPSENFKKWKMSVLNQAKLDARAAIHNEKGTSPERISDDEALERAALDAFRQHGL